MDLLCPSDRFNATIIIVLVKYSVVRNAGVTILIWYDESSLRIRVVDLWDLSLLGQTASRFQLSCQSESSFGETHMVLACVRQNY